MVLKIIQAQMALIAQIQQLIIRILQMLLILQARIVIALLIVRIQRITQIKIKIFSKK